MSQWKLAGSAAVIALLSAGSALAQVTPEEVWQNWQSASQAMGQTIKADSIARDGDTLRLTGVTISGGDDSSRTEATLAELNFTDNGDGTVGITLSDTYPITMTLPSENEGGTPVAAAASITMPGMAMTASGTPDAVKYDFTAPEIGISFDVVEDANSAKVTARLTNVSGSELIAGTEAARTVDTSFAAATMTLDMQVNDSESATSVVGTITANDLAGKGKANFAGIDLENLAEALRLGFMVDGGISHGAMTYDISVTDATGPTKMTGAAETGSFAMAMGADSFRYSTGSTGLSMLLVSAQLPFPEVKLSWSEVAFDLMMPLTKSDTPSDFRFLTRIADLQVSEEIWGMMDPTGQLPHDPATIVLDASGKARLTTDLVDDAAMESLGDGAPGELHALDLTELRAKIAGAELTGAGALTFDNTDLATFGGMPAPTGKIDLKLVGGNTLMDKLVAMGLLSQDDVMGARMMLSMFANAGPGEDELTSTLEFKDKHFYANGQQLQ